MLRYVQGKKIAHAVGVVNKVISNPWKRALH